MKYLIFHLLPFLALAMVLHAQEPSRVWTNAATASKIEGTLVRKTRDNSKFTLRMADGKEREFNTAILIQTDMDYVMNWKSIVTDRATQISQAQGGGSRIMEDLECVLRPYGKAVEATGPHPEAIVYKGQAWYDGGPQITIPYLMPLDKAVALLVQRPGVASRSSADTPGLPPGMKTHEYDVKFGVYNRMVIIADQYDQVVALEAKSENKNDPATPQPAWQAANTPNFSTSSYIKKNTQGARVFVCDLMKTEKRIVIDSEFSGENLLFLPEPLINLCLFHIDQDLRKRDKLSPAARGDQNRLSIVDWIVGQWTFDYKGEKRIFQINRDHTFFGHYPISGKYFTGKWYDKNGKIVLTRDESSGDWGEILPRAGGAEFLSEIHKMMGLKSKP